MAKYKQGLFECRNPEKYQGNHSNCIYRSSWELLFMKWCDINPALEKWSSEEVIVPYTKPTTGKTHRYFPDFMLYFKDGRTIMVEVKPFAETKAPKKGKNEQTYINAIMTFEVNTAKWNAAKEFCKNKGWSFMIITEKELGL